MSKLNSNYELISNKASNPVTTTPYIKHGEKWLDEMLNESGGRIDAVEDGVAANTEAISQNTTNISTNTTNISGLDTRVTALEQGGGGGGGGDNVGRIDRTEGATQHGEIFNMYTASETGGGSANEATGYMTHAEGESTKASGGGAHSEGGYTTASGTYSHAEGSSSVASGSYSHSEGFNTHASAAGTHAEGNSTYATMENSHAEGVRTKASGNSAHAEGESTEASGYSAHAEGGNSEASGARSHAEGSSSKATNSNAHAEGYHTTASGENSHAEGHYTEATGENSHAEGSYTKSKYYRTHAEGLRTEASGENSHAEGYYTKAASPNQHVSGRCNIADLSGKYAEIVGNGSYTGGGESNARTLDWYGNAWYAGDVTGNKDGVEYKLSDMKDKYTLPEGGIPASDLAEGVLPTVTDEYNPEGTAAVSGKAVAAAISGKLDSNQKGASGGVAELDANGKVLSSQLPSYVDDVVEASSKSAFPTTGESGKIYVDTTANLTYRWTGTAYTEISPSIALGETASTAFRGDHGKTAYDHATTTATNPHGTTKSDVGLGNVGNFKAVSTVASQGLTDTEKSNARANIGAGTYSKDSNGIPKTDLASAVQTSLGLADTALQSHQSLADYVKTTDSRLTDARASNDVQAYAKTGSGITVAKSVPSDAKFTDTTYSAATTSANGLMSSSDKTKLNGIATGATAVSESTVSGWGFTKNAGTVTKVKVGSSGTEYSPSSGVVTIPAYPTSLPASNTTNSYSATGTVPVSGAAVAAALSSYVKTDDARLTNAREPAFGSNKWYSVGDDVKMGDHNVAGGLGIMGVNGNTRLDFCKYGDSTVYKSIIFDGTNLSIDGKVLAAAATKGVDTTMPTTPTDNGVPSTNLMKTQLDNKVQKTSVSSGVNSTTSVINVTDAKAQMAMVAKIKGKTQKVVQQFPTTVAEGLAQNAVTSSSYDANTHEFTIKAGGGYSGFYLTNTVITFGHTYYFTATFKVPKAGTVRLVRDFTVSAANTYTKIETVEKISGNAAVYNVGATSGDTFYLKDIMAIDLTEMFGAGKEPTTVAQISRMFGSYVPKGSYLWNAPVESVLSQKGNNKTAALVPSEVRNCVGYGLGISDSVCNIADFENGVNTQMVNEIDLTSLTWGYDTTYKYFYSNAISNIKKPNWDAEPSIICSKYTGGNWSNNNGKVDKRICVNYTSGIIGITDFSYTDATAFKNALSNAKLVYELATPVVTPLKDFIRPLPVEQGGTLTLVNEHNLDMPSVIKYKKEVN